MLAALWRSDSPARVASTMLLARVGVILVGVGMAGTIVFGIWLAISLDAYQLWDGWVIAALVLWAVGGFTGQQSGQGYQAGQRARREARGRGHDGRAQSSPRSSAPHARSGSTSRRSSSSCSSSST